MWGHTNYGGCSATAFRVFGDQFMFNLNCPGL